jgi:hypothetical protein
MNAGQIALLFSCCSPLTPNLFGEILVAAQAIATCFAGPHSVGLKRSPGVTAA